MIQVRDPEANSMQVECPLQTYINSSIWVSVKDGTLSTVLIANCVIGFYALIQDIIRPDKTRVRKKLNI